jgi:hypothetical protein
MDKRVLITVAALLILTKSKGQGELSKYLQTGLVDAQLLGKAYIAPLANVYGISANANWVQSAKVLKPGRFRIGTSISAIELTDVMKNYDPSQLGLESVELSTSMNKLPTVFGQSNPTGMINVFGKNQAGNRELWTSFHIPPGLGYKWFAAPQVQFSIGIGLNTQLMFRYFPKNKFVLFDNIEGSVSLFGLGFMHHLSPYIFKKKKDIMDISVFASYNRLTSDIATTLLPDYTDARYTVTVPVTNFLNQNLGLVADNWQIGLAISKKLSSFTFFTNVAYQASDIKLGFQGQYPFINGYDPQNNNKLLVGAYRNPLTLNFVEPNFQFQAGMKVKFLWAMYLTASYSYIGSTNMFNAGAGFAWE